MNREFLKEAIADAKAVKESAIANAKAALEESFTPHLKSMLAAKINEMEIEEEEEMYEAKTKMEDEDMNENFYLDEEKEEMDEEMNLDEILAELEEMDEEQLNEVEEEEEYEDSDADGIPDEKDETPEGEAEEEEEIDLEDMSEEELKSFIESVIADMVEAGELESGSESEEEEEEEELEITMEAEDEMDEAKDAKYRAMEAKMKKMEEELNETRNAFKTIKTDLNEVNLLNAKLLYTNKIFRNKNLTESQKVKVLGAFDKAASVKEAKLVFETITESLNTSKKPVNESVIGRASKSAGVSTTTKQPIVESNEMITRFQKLAGII